MTFKRVSGAVTGIPLSVVPAIALDTETTGLDFASDRIIEFGAIRVSPTHAGEVPEFSALVHPGMPIPAASIAVHGISDPDVAGASSFPEIMKRLAEWAGASLVIGFSIGFDLAVLKAEHERYGLQWRPPRALDVRHLLEVVSPGLGALSLEAAAARFSIPVSERHRALPDARLAAALYKAVVPMLRERGIQTLGQAERAVERRATVVAGETRAGWSAHRLTAGEAASLAEYARIDSFAFRHRTGELMSAPALTIAGDRSLRDALQEMMTRRVSSLFVPGTSERELGIVTERDVLRGLAEQGADALELPVARFSSQPLLSIRSDEFVYRALALMSSRGIRHLGVVDADGHLAGALSARDLLRQRAEDAIVLGTSIESAATPEELGRIWLNLPKVARALDLEDVDARDVAAVVSRELRAMTKRAAELAEAEMLAAGRGPPPVPYALMVLGSGGRGESLLAMDQDNALVYAAGDDAAETDAWFEHLAERVTRMLNDAGVAYCKGGVMATNAAWRMDINRWKAMTRSWIGRTRPADILSCDIFFDAVAVHGDGRLFEEVWSEAAAVAGQSRPFLSLLALHAADIGSPFNWRGRLKLETGRIDLKRFGLMPIFSAARVLALRHAIRSRSTAERLATAAELGVVPETTARDLIEGHRILLGAILRQQLRDIEAGLTLSNAVAAGDLDAHENESLIWALHRVQQVSGLLGTPA